MRYLLLLAMVGVLAGCASSTAVLQNWVGAPESELLRRWGKPNRVTETAEGGKVLEYAKERFAIVPTPRPSDFPGQITRMEYVEYQFWCRTRFEVSGEGTIVGFRYEGNDCDPIKRR